MKVQFCSSLPKIYSYFVLKRSKMVGSKNGLIMEFYSHINLDFKSISPYPYTKLAVLSDFLQVCFKNIQFPLKCTSKYPNYGQQN